MRDALGSVLLHGRRSFVLLHSKEEASFECLVWALKSMYSHRFSKVIFDLEDAVLVGVVNRPQAWPSFSFQAFTKFTLLSLVKVFEDWSLVLVKPDSNRGADLIAQSVTGDGRFQSYVASSFPFWLGGLFANEKVLSSV